MALSPFEEIDPEIRQEWLDHHVTRAYLHSLKQTADRIADGVLLTSQGENINVGRLQVAGGELRALGFALELARKPR